MTTLQRPPIPQVQLVDDKGFVTREWRRWFSLVGVVVDEQGSQISDTKTTIENVVVFDAPLAPLDDPVDTAAIARLGLELRLLQDATASQQATDPDTATLRALMLQRPADELPVGTDGQLLTLYNSRPIWSRTLNPGDHTLAPLFSAFFFDPVTSVLNLINKVGTDTRLQMAGFSGAGAVGPGSGACSIDFSASRGSPAAPAGLHTGDVIFNMTGNGYGSTGNDGPGLQLRGTALQNWSDTVQGSGLDVNIVPIGSGWPSSKVAASFRGEGTRILGTNTNDNAAAGNYGEFASAVVPGISAVTLTTNIIATIASLSLTAGDWDVNGNIEFLFSVAGATAKAVEAEISQQNATMNDTDAGTAYAYFDLPSSNIGFIGLPVGTARLILSGTTTVYLTGIGYFSSGTCVAYGTLRARRIR